MKAGTLLLRPSVLFLALALVVFVTVVALNSGDSSAQVICEPDPSTGTCSGGGPLPDGGGGGGHVSCTPGEPDCTFTGGAKLPDGGAGGKLFVGAFETTEDDCVLAGRIPEDACLPSP
jgi:hypothetical protein